MLLGTKTTYGRELVGLVPEILFSPYHSGERTDRARRAATDVAEKLIVFAAQDTGVLAGADYVRVIDRTDFVHLRANLGEVDERSVRIATENALHVSHVLEVLSDDVARLCLAGSNLVQHSEGATAPRLETINKLYSLALRTID